MVTPASFPARKSPAWPCLISSVARRRAVLLVLLGGTITGCAQNAATTVTVDAQANRRAINPNIYGVSYSNKQLNWFGRDKQLFLPAAESSSKSGN